MCESLKTITRLTVNKFKTHEGVKGTGSITIYVHFCHKDLYNLDKDN